MSVVSPDVRNARPAGELVTLSIDGRQVSVPRGTTVLRAALQAGIYIPHLCDFKDLAPYAGCRMCLVDIEKMRGLDTSCTIQAREGMVVRTDTPAVREYQRSVLEVILSDHPDRCFTCNRYERCEPLGICQRDDLVLERCLTCAKNRQLRASARRRLPRPARSSASRTPGGSSSPSARTPSSRSRPTTASSARAARGSATRSSARRRSTSLAAAATRRSRSTSRRS